MHNGRSKNGYKKSIALFINVESVTNDETDPLFHIGKDKTTYGENENQERYETEYYDFLNNGSLVGSDEEEEMLK